MSIPTLNLRNHANGAEAQVACTHMSLVERLSVLQAALTTLITGRFQICLPHVRTLHRGTQTQLAYLPRVARHGAPEAEAAN